MPRKRAAIASTDDPATPITKPADSGQDELACRASGAEGNQGAALHESAQSIEADHWICVDQPFWDFEFEHDHAEGEEELAEDRLHLEYTELVSPSRSMWCRAAEDHPRWKWVMLGQTWTILCDLQKQASYCDPDNFDMYVYNDFYGYALRSLIEKTVERVAKEWNKKSNTNPQLSLQHNWAVASALGHWLCNVELFATFARIDDGEGVTALVHLVGYTFLAILGAVDAAGQLTADSPYRDLGLVMSLYLRWSGEFDTSESDAADGKDWRAGIVAYADKAGIDLEAVGCSAVIDSIEQYRDGGPGPRSVKLREYKREYGLGTVFLPEVPGYDITKWPSTLRAEYHFENTDPLANIAATDLASGNVMLY